MDWPYFGSTSPTLLRPMFLGLNYEYGSSLQYGANSITYYEFTRWRLFLHIVYRARSARSTKMAVPTRKLGNGVPIRYAEPIQWFQVEQEEMQRLAVCDSSKPNLIRQHRIEKKKRRHYSVYFRSCSPCNAPQSHQNTTRSTSFNISFRKYAACVRDLLVCVVFYPQSRPYTQFTVPLFIFYFFCARYENLMCSASSSGHK